MSVVQNWLGFGAVVRGDRQQVRKGGGKGAKDTGSIYLTPYKLFGTANQIRSEKAVVGGDNPVQKNKHPKTGFTRFYWGLRRVLHPSQISTIPYHSIQHPRVRWDATCVSNPRWLGTTRFYKQRWLGAQMITLLPLCQNATSPKSNLRCLFCYRIPAPYVLAGVPTTSLHHQRWLCMVWYGRGAGDPSQNTSRI